MGWDLLNHFLNSVAQYVLTGVFALLCAFLGVKLRQRKNKKESISND